MNKKNLTPYKNVLIDFFAFYFWQKKKRLGRRENEKESPLSTKLTL